MPSFIFVDMVNLVWDLEKHGAAAAVLAASSRIPNDAFAELLRCALQGWKTVPPTVRELPTKRKPVLE
jgi:hypothetical protein